MRRTVAGAFIALTAWAALMVIMPFVGPSGRQVAVVGDTDDAVRAVIAAGGRVVELRRNAVIAQSSQPDFVRALYHVGARLVIEGRIAAGCFSLSPQAR